MCRICLYSSCAVIHALTNRCFVTYFVLIGLLASFMGAAWFLIFHGHKSHKPSCSAKTLVIEF